MSGRSILLNLYRRRGCIRTSSTCKTDNAISRLCKNAAIYPHTSFLLNDAHVGRPILPYLRLFSVDICLDPIIPQCDNNDDGSSSKLDLGSENRATERVSSRNRGSSRSPRKLKKNGDINGNDGERVVVFKSLVESLDKQKRDGVVVAESKDLENLGRNVSLEEEALQNRVDADISGQHSDQSGKYGSYRRHKEVPEEAENHLINSSLSNSVEERGILGQDSDQLEKYGNSQNHKGEGSKGSRNIWRKFDQFESHELGKHSDQSGKYGNHRSYKEEGSEETENPSAKVDLFDPLQVFQCLVISRPPGMLKHEKDALAQIFRHFLEDGWALQQALFRCYVSSVVFPIAVSRFRKFFFSRCTPDIRAHLLELGPSSEGDEFLFPLFSEFSSREFPSEISRYKALVERADLTKPHTWFPFARAMTRRIIYHSGPTNSGKTYNAIQRFKAAGSGIYCGPLRLLAMEIFDSVNADGVYCSLTTGQEKKEVPFANHVACTVEMVSTQKTWEVAVIDEIQMLADEFRGWAWTRAFLGLQANEIHVCGDPTALRLVRDICAITGDEMEECHYERFDPLSIDQHSLEGKYGNICPGDCIVSFSRKEIFSIKRAVELATSNRCCVIYGALPPETRRHQAKLFNDPNSGYDVLVATDAIGMGLNLNIKRVVFHSLEKYDGKTQIKVSASQVKQIAGRAGRRGTLYQIGTATTFYSRDIPYLVQCMEEPFSATSSAGLFPMYEQIELFATQMPEATFSKLLDRFAETCQLDGSFFLCRNDNLKKVAGIIDKVKGLTLEDKMSFILAPVNSRDPRVINALLSFALAYSKKLPVHLAMATPMGSAKSIVQLMDLETRHQILSLYLWLSHHFPEECFPQKEQAGQMAADIALLLGESLAQQDIRIVQKDHEGHLRKRATRRPSRFTLRT